MRDTHEYFLDTFFHTIGIAKNGLPQAKQEELFFCLSKAFLLDGEDADKLWLTVNSECVSQIVDKKDFLQYSRVKQYSQEILQKPIKESELEAEVVTLKGSALTQAIECGLITDKLEGKERIITNLVNKAGEGCLSALRVLGVMQLHGICVEKDETAGLENLRKSVLWNDIEGSMIYLYYCQYDRQNCFNHLLTSLQMRYNTSLIRALNEAYPEQAKAFRQDGIARLIEKSFNSARLTRYSYSSPKARILNSEILSFQDKEFAIFSMEGKQLRSPICDLPLKLSLSQSIDLNTSAFDGFVLLRDEEIKEVLGEARNFDLRRTSNYTPTCLCADSGLLAGYYVEAIKRLVKDANVQVIEVRDLTRSDVDASVKNVFVRKCDEDRPNVYIMRFRGAIDDDIMDVALDFLRTTKRRAFSLREPALQLDLSAILPICVCDKANEVELKKFCNVINLQSVSFDEKALIIDDMLSRSARQYGIQDITIDKDVKDSIQKLSTDSIAKALDKVILANRVKGCSLILDESKMARILDEFNTISTYGFGGSINEKQR